MELIHKKFKHGSLDEKWVITIGNFDGYHLGHQALVNQVLRDKVALNARGAILTFDPHPKKVLQSHVPFRHLYSDESKWAFMEESGLDACFIIPFTLEFANLHSMDFLNQLFDLAFIRKIVVGYDFNFGKAREGSASFMKEEAEKRGIDFMQLAPVKIGDLTVSSTMIRRLLFECDFKNATRFLGRPWSVDGIVREGKRIGNTIGFPTMNIEPEVLLPLKKGVFASEVEIEGELYKAVCNVGVRPTFNGKVLKVEAHLFNYSGDAYGKRIEVTPMKYLREEKKFNSVNELTQQIKKDVENSTRFFDNA